MTGDVEEQEKQKQGIDQSSEMIELLEAEDSTTECDHQLTDNIKLFIGHELTPPTNFE